MRPVSTRWDWRRQLATQLSIVLWACLLARGAHAEPLYVSAPDHYSVQFPGKPHLVTPPPGWKPGPGRSMTATVKGVGYTVIWTPEPIGQALPTAAFLDKEADSEAYMVGSEITERHAVSVDGTPGLEFVFKGTDAGGSRWAFTARLFLRDHRLYKVWVDWHPTRHAAKTPNKADVTAFLDSFHFDAVAP